MSTLAWALFSWDGQTLHFGWPLVIILVLVGGLFAKDAL